MIQLNRINVNKPGGLVVCVSMLILMVNLPAAALSDTYQFSHGDVAAIQLNLYARTAWTTIVEQYDAPLLAVYDTTEGKFIINIYGAKDRTTVVQETIDQFRKLLKKDFIPYLKKMQDIDLKMSDVRIIYRNRNEEGAKEILIWENYEFNFPSDK